MGNIGQNGKKLKMRGYMYLPFGHKQHGDQVLDMGVIGNIWKPY